MNAARRNGPPSVAVVGAGIAGLATAWSLLQGARQAGREIRCAVFEEDARWGGKLVTELVETGAGRFVVDGGPDSFLNVQKPWATRLALDLGLGDRLIGTNDAARRVYVVNKGRPVRLPEGVFLLVPTRFWPFVSSPLISPRGKVRMGMDLVLPADRGRDDETMASFVRRRLGSEALDKIAEPLLAGIYNAEAERQSIMATFPRFRELERRHGSLIRGMLAAQAARRRTARPPAGGSGAPEALFVTLRNGVAELSDELAARIGPLLRLGTSVAALERTGRGYRLTLRPGSGARAAHGGRDRTGRDIETLSGRETDAGAGVAGFDGTDGALAGDDASFAADAVVLAVPAFTAAALLGEQAPAAAAELAAIRYVSTGVATFAYRAADVPHDHGFGVLMPRSQRRPINAVTFSSTKFDGRAPAGHVLLRVFFGGSRSAATMGLDDDDLEGVVRSELRDLLGIGGTPLFTRVHRWPRANPQYDVGHLERVARMEEALPAGIHVTGSAYLGVGIPDCVRQAAAVAGRVLAGLPAASSAAPAPAVRTA